MPVSTRYTFIDDTVIELVTKVEGEDTSIDVNILRGNPGLSPSESFSEEEVAPVLCASAPSPTKKKRSLMGFIRAGWFVIFTVVGEALTYALNNLTSLNLPPGTATAIGAVGYGVKKVLWPNAIL